MSVSGKNMLQIAFNDHLFTWKGLVELIDNDEEDKFNSPTNCKRINQDQLYLIEEQSF